MEVHCLQYQLLSDESLDAGVFFAGTPLSINGGRTSRRGWKETHLTHRRLRKFINISSQSTFNSISTTSVKHSWNLANKILEIWPKKVFTYSEITMYHLKFLLIPIMLKKSKSHPSLPSNLSLNFKNATALRHNLYAMSREKYNAPTPRYHWDKWKKRTPWFQTYMGL